MTAFTEDNQQTTSPKSAQLMLLGAALLLFSMIWPLIFLFMQFADLRELPPDKALPVVSGEIIGVMDRTNTSAKRVVVKADVTLRTTTGDRVIRVTACEDGGTDLKLGQIVHAVTHNDVVIAYSVDARECRSLAKFRARANQIRESTPFWITLWSLVLLVQATTAAMLIWRYNASYRA